MTKCFDFFWVPSKKHSTIVALNRIYFSSPWLNNRIKSIMKSKNIEKSKHHKTKSRECKKIKARRGNWKPFELNWDFNNEPDANNWIFFHRRWLFSSSSFESYYRSIEMELTKNYYTNISSRHLAIQYSLIIAGLLFEERLSERSLVIFSRDDDETLDEKGEKHYNNQNIINSGLLTPHW